ncbi:MAG: FAD-dependent oxidoreductase [Candidatus Lokiarchaeota archaeon]|nr:FAD-dependent oxidoreductase [Candidatus Lokiarchaeota archaeon]
MEDRKCPLIKNYRLCAHCGICAILSGVGGAGTYSSGLLNLSPDIGGDLSKLSGSKEKAIKFIEKIDSIFVKHGSPNKKYRPNDKKIEEIKNKAASVGVKFIPITQRHIGTENAPNVIKSIQDELENKKNVTFLLRSEVKSIKNNEIILLNGITRPYDFLLLAPGRSGMVWLTEQMQELGVETKYEPISIGVRVEVPSYIMNSVCNFERDPKFHIYPKTYDDFVRTFCVNHEGYVVQERYPDESVATNGHSFETEKSENSNFALLVQISLTEPLEDTTAYGKSIAYNCGTLGGGKPLLQRLGDIHEGRRSNWDRINKNAVQPTLKSVTPGDISMALPHRIFVDIIESIEKLDHILPGLNSSSTLLYAPEIKYSAKRVITNNFLETSVPNLFVAGDGAGLTRGIVAAAVTGLIAAEGILKKMN